MEQSEAPQTPKKPSIVVGSILLAVLCIAVFAYCVVRTDRTSDVAHETGYALGIALIWVLIFHFAIAKRRGTGFANVSFLLIVVSVAAGSWIGFRGHDNREQMAKMRASMLKEVDALSSAMKEAKPTGKIETTPAAQGEVGEMERFGRTFLSRMAEQRNEYLRQLGAIGWDKVLDMQRIAGDKTLAQSKAMVRKARPLVALYKDEALATIESARADIDKLPIGESRKAGFRKGFEKSLEASRGRLLEQLDLEARIVDEVGALFDLLSAKSGAWAIRDGKIVFSEQATLSSFNGHIAEIQKMAARQEALQKQATDSTRAKLEAMK